MPTTTISTTKSSTDLGQTARLIVLAASISILAVGAVLITGTFPKLDSSGLWFYTAVVGVFLGDLVVEPWYTRPADAVANGVAVFLACLSASGAGLSVTESEFESGRAAVMVYAVIVVGVAIVAMVTQRPRGQKQPRIHRIAYTGAGAAGRASVIFWVLFTFSATASFADEPITLLFLYLFGGILLAQRPLREIAIRTLTAAKSTQDDLRVLVTELGEPNSFMATVPRELKIEVGSVLETGGAQVGVVTNKTSLGPSAIVQATSTGKLEIEPGDLLELSDVHHSEVLGVAEIGTDLDRVVISASSDHVDGLELVEGGLVSAKIRGEDVLFQIVDVELVRATNDGGGLSRRTQLTGRKLGVWNGDSFESADWVPQPGAIVSSAQVARTENFDPKYVGRVPGTDYGVEYDPSTGATHNTAVLGILGSGKTTLAVELIHRTLAHPNRPKVIVLDITNEYSKHFEGLFGPAQQAQFEADLNEKIRDRVNAKDHQDGDAGNKTLFRTELGAAISHFLQSDDPILIINPANLVVTGQGGGFPDNYGQAKFVISLSPAEIAALIAREMLSALSGTFSEDVRACLVLEEAHTLAPEWNSTANDGEKQAATATARALMQGRKFGFGSIVVTQRTANVTKSILNQCNTIFALRVYDQTGTEFLGNFIGPDYSRLLANLRDHHAVVFGRASSCKSPLLVELNNPAEMLDWRADIEASANAHPTESTTVAELAPTEG